MARNIHVRGIVQGVGFRPFVYRLAQELGVHGWVLNAVDGVHIHAEAFADTLERFVQAIEKEAPVAAHISSLTWEEVPDEGRGGFVIKTSDSEGQKDTSISPDLATCPQCKQELFDQTDRRFRYPFINCTNCGPRFTIINRLPYDRLQTTMADFELCEDCSGEYGDVLDRRFHAQPNACFSCGPQLELVVPGTGEHLVGSSLAESDALIERAACLLEEGKILAVKGLGGYHLVCDATNEVAVQELRTRKQRPRKPLAVMYASLEDVRDFFALNGEEAALLTSPAAPIVLLRNREHPPCHPEQSEGSFSFADTSKIIDNTQSNSNGILATSITCGVTETGVMLPATPLQHLLLAAVSFPLVMTSGNISEEPIIGDTDLAERALSSVADVFIHNNRAIVSRYDDSVLRVLEMPSGLEAVVLPCSEEDTHGTTCLEDTKQNTKQVTASLSTQYVRRARGYAPRPLEFAPELPKGCALLAVGPEQKNTFCLARGTQAFVSQHLGDLENASSFNNQLETIGLYEQLFDVEPSMLVCDMHPEYLSTKWAHEQARQKELVLKEVQHHHAHIAAVLAENAYESEVIGLALDGTGYGTDGSVWGGEVLVASLAESTRFASLEPFALPGGAQAIGHPLRSAYALLYRHELTEHPAAASVKEALGDTAVKLIEQMIEQGLNSPLTSSAGRLFDAVSALLAVCTEASYEGEPAILLEASMYKESPSKAQGENGSPSCHDEKDSSHALGMTEAGHPEQSVGSLLLHNEELLESEDTHLIIPTRALVLRLLDMLQEGAPKHTIARSFHNMLMQLFLKAANAARNVTGLTTVALSGGVFNNRYLASTLPGLLGQAGFEVLTHVNLPPNDGCISYGQAAVASAQLAKSHATIPTNLTIGGATL